MQATPQAPSPAPRERAGGEGARPITIAVLAMGGEGGGVLADWIVDLGEHNGYIAQTTSVPGVAQRTGATIYYVELFPRAAAQAAGAPPVLALMPLPGDVDLVLASELMEAARAVQRGLVTPDRTTLVASTHRVYAIAEKSALGDGRADADLMLDKVREAARRFVGFDMAALAEAQGSVISAVLFGALAATGALPFDRAQFAATIERGGIGVKSSLAAFDAAYQRAQQPPAEATPVAFTLPKAADPEMQALLDRAAREHTGAALPLVVEGLRRLVDWQDPAYAVLYLDRLKTTLAAAPASATETLAPDLARHLALWMAYEDTVRVADLKTRDTRFARVAAEVRVQPGQVLAFSEFMHPRLQEIADTLPAALGRWLLASGAPRRWVQRVAGRGRVVDTSSLGGFLLLWTLAGLRRWRRGMLRYQVEQQRIEAWLADVRAALQRGDAALAAEIVRCQRLVKGYGDTHERGLANFERLRKAWTGRALPAAALAELRSAALADEQGQVLTAALQRLGITG
ncbi:MAG: indolepyruvate oxidoreductase subunit beta family protein [Rubrivivax sp.]